jgi:hypothetical protein
MVKIGLLLISGLAGCGDYEAKVSCSSQQSCIALAGSLYAGDASPDTLPQCCNGFCVVRAGGCDSGYRYLDNDPAPAACVVELTCGAPPSNDMSMSKPAADMSSRPDSGGDGGN